MTEETIEQELSLNDDRRVKVLSPGALVAKRFFRNRLAVVGLTMLVVMFVFSFIGGLISPYGQDEQFYTYTHMDKSSGCGKKNDLRYTINDGQEFGSILQAQLMLAIGKNAESFEYKDVTYEVEKEGEDLYLISSNGTVLAIAAKDIVNAADGAEASALTFAVKHEALKAYANGETSFTADGQDYTMDADGNILSGSDEIGYVSRFVVQAKENGVVISRDFKENWQMPSTAIPKNLYTLMQTVRNTPTPSLTNRIPRPGLYCSRRKPMCMTVMQVPPKHTGSAPIQTVWIC